MYEAILSATHAHSSILTLGDGGTWSYGGTADPLNMLPPFDKGIKLAMGQANVKRWSDDPMPLVTDETGPGVMDLCTHRLPLDQAPYGYEILKEDGAIKVVLEP